MTTKEPTSLPLEWLKAIPRELAEKSKKPLLGFPPKFPWTPFAEKLQQTLGLPSLQVEGSPPEWREPKDLFKGMGKKLVPTPLTIAGMEGTLWWIMEEADIHYLMSLILTKKKAPFPVLDAEFEAGFTQFLMIEVLHAIQTVGFDQTLSPKLTEESHLPESTCLTVDVTALLEKKKIKGRLFFSEEFEEACHSHYAKKSEHEAAQSPIGNQLEIDLGLQIGATSIPIDTWNEVGVGDFIVLDTCSWIPEEEKGRVILTSRNTPLFRGRLKKGKIKILEYPLYHEVDTMADYEEEESEIEENEHEAEAEHPQEEREESIDEESVDKGQEESGIVDEEPEEAPVEGVEASPEEPLTTTDEIPLNVVIEVGRLRMTIQKLAELSPGNILDLNIHPEAGVDLVINGRRVAKGELLRVGDTLGVRLLEMG